MSELSRAARDKLALALSELSAPTLSGVFAQAVPEIGRAIGALYRVQAAPAGVPVEADLEAARAGLRAALIVLQECAAPHPGLDRALENVAACLGLTYQITEARPAAPPLPPMEPMAAAPAYHPSRPVSSPRDSTPTSPPLDSPKTTPGAAYVSPAPSPDLALQNTALSSDAAAPRSRHDNPALSSTQNSPGVQRTVKTQPSAVHPPISLESTQTSAGQVAQPSSSARSGTMPSAGQHPDPRWSAPESRHAPPPPEGPEPGSVRIEATLAAHSPTNFYKGLRGNDVVEHGGLFVATYEAPGVGTPVWLSVLLPGGYSFDASAVVRWTRRQGSSDAPPGFGATFVSLSPEARQLVHRFTKNREPLFHDDL